jgi:hypothetical protein
MAADVSVDGMTSRMELKPFMAADVSVDGMTSRMELKPFYKVFGKPPSYVSFGIVVRDQMSYIPFCVD